MITVDKFYNSCGVTMLPLWFGLVLPLGIIGVFHFILIALLLIKVMRDNNYSSSDQQKISYYNTAVVLTLLSCAVYFGCAFGLLYVHPQLSEYSVSFQVIFSVCILSQGVLMFIYSLCASEHAYKFWTSFYRAVLKFACCSSNLRCSSSRQATNISEPISNISTNTNEAYVTVRTQHHIRSYNLTENEGYGQELANISTDTNEAYMIMRTHHQNERYNLTENEAYSQFSKPSC